MMYGWNGDWGTMFLAMALNAVVWIALIGLLVWGVSRLFTNRTPATGSLDRGPSAQEILRQRYARGEIDAATFEEMRRTIDSTPTPAGM